MSNPLSERIKSLPASATLAMAAKARELKNEGKDIFIDNTPKCSARSYLTLIINPAINEDKQKKLVNDFNNYLSENRKKYNSLFLANYRESNDIARKRISFDLVYKIIGHLID